VLDHIHAAVWPDFLGKRDLGGEKMVNKLFLIMALSIALTVGLTTVAKATECKQLHAQIISTPTSTGCTSPVGLCTAGTIQGNQGLHGTTFYTMTSIAPGPSTAPNPADTISFSGVLEVTTAGGTLISHDTGIFDPSTGTPTSGFFSSFDTVTNGTGKIQGATGNFFIGGKTIEGKFVSEIRGEICLP